MSGRQSLFDQDSDASTGSRARTIQIAGAAVLLLGAIGVLGWGLGLFDRGPGANSEDQAELNERFEQQAQEEEERDRSTRERRTNAGG